MRMEQLSLARTEDLKLSELPRAVLLITDKLFMLPTIARPVRLMLEPTLQ